MAIGPITLEDFDIEATQQGREYVPDLSASTAQYGRLPDTIFTEKPVSKRPASVAGKTTTTENAFPEDADLCLFLGCSLDKKEWPWTGLPSSTDAHERYVADYKGQRPGRGPYFAAEFGKGFRTKTALFMYPDAAQPLDEVFACVREFARNMNLPRPCMLAVSIKDAGPIWEEAEAAAARQLDGRPRLDYALFE